MYTKGSHLGQQGTGLFNQFVEITDSHVEKEKTESITYPLHYKKWTHNYQQKNVSEFVYNLEEGKHL